jgi:hypothetical protein
MALTLEELSLTTLMFVHSQWRKDSMRRFIMVPMMLAAFINTSVGWTQQKALAVTTRDTMYKYRAVNENNGFILGISFPSLMASSTALQRSNNSLGNGVYTVTNVNSGLALDVYNCGGANGNEIDTWTLLNNTCQMWSVLPTGDGHYALVSSVIGRTLDDKNCGTANGTVVQTWQWLDNTCQEWSTGS